MVWRDTKAKRKLEESDEVLKIALLRVHECRLDGTPSLAIRYATGHHPACCAYRRFPSRCKEG